MNAKICPSAMLRLEAATKGKASYCGSYKNGRCLEEKKKCDGCYQFYRKTKK